MIDQVKKMPSLIVPQGDRRLGRKNAWAVTGLVVFWVILSGPILLWSQWFPLDMPALFEIGGHLEKRLPWIVSPHSGSGRYVPVYWLYYSLQYVLFGAKVWPYFLVLGLVYLGGVLLVCRTFWRMTKSFFLCCVLFIALYLNSPTAENLSTIGKPEALAFFVIALMVYRLQLSIARRSMDKRTLVVLVAGFLTSIWIKETSLVIVVLAVFGLAAHLLASKAFGTINKNNFAKPYAWLAAASVLGLVLSRLPYVVFTNTSNQPNYISYRITLDLVRDNFEFYLNQQPDVLLFGVLSLALAPFMLLRAWRVLQKTSGDSAIVQNGWNDLASLIFAAGLCVTGWAYVTGMLIWRWPMAYYLLLPSIFFKFSFLYFVYYRARVSLHRAWINMGATLLILLSMAYGALNYYYVTTSQIEYSRIYTASLQEFKRYANGQNRLIIDSYPFYAEQIGGTGAFLKNQLGVHNEVVGIGEILEPAALKPEILDLLQITDKQLQENVGKMPRRGDMLLTFTGNKLATWFLRGVTPYFSEDSLLKKEDVYAMKLVSQKTLHSPALYLHEWTGLIVNGPTSLGYKLYRIESDEPRFLWLGRYPDGWVGKTSSLKINSDYQAPVALKISVPAFTLPNYVRILQDGRMVRELDFTDTNELTVPLDVARGQAVQLKFEVSKSVSPKKIGMNKDDRSLGARIALTTAATDTQPSTSVAPPTQ